MRRHSSASTGFHFDWDWSITPAIQLLVIACAVVFLVQELSRVFFGPAGWNFWLVYFGLVPRYVTHGFIWQPFTYLFL
ncbi:MAG: hypothetical protein WA020_04060, partial [Candidatus Acidiferrales bacterium]